MDYKQTLNLPRTAFPMKGNLPQAEPKMLARWDEERLYQQILADRSGAKPFVLHDGPPYANGDIHIGHALNKILKDFIVRHRNMQGRRAPYVPGWDCHGLPIEYALMKELKTTKHQVDIVEFRKKARAYAQKYVGIQRDQFKRLGVMGDWENPYLTLQPEFVCAELRVLKTLVEKGFVYQARKPVNWCWSCETALAEAEVEYEDREDQSVFVKFPISKKHSESVQWPGVVPEDASVLIWTTTPWTLIANIGLCFHPDEMYSLVEAKKGNRTEFFLLGKKRVDAVLGKAGYSIIRELWNSPGKIFAYQEDGKRGLRCESPFFGETFSAYSLGMEDPSVSMDEGTGVIHIAPDHGQEDHVIARRYHAERIDLPVKVDEKGRYTDEITLKFPAWKDKTVQKLNPIIVEELRHRERLISEETVRHSYPHCWRCHNPIIFRATDQWFLKIEHDDLRKKLLQAVDQDVQWIPAVGRERMTGMIKTRPDWCLSRQRLWGVPVPAVVCKACGKEELVPAVIENFVKAIENDPEGTDRWFSEPVEKWLPAGFACPHCKQGKEFERGTDILDVWFDSGVSHQGVVAQRKELAPPPADLYLEGSDQHRGWFQVSLITGVALSGKAPYRGVLTHGFVVDGEGRKMSKSLGNVIAPQQVISSMGADVLRLWVASSDYAEDVRLSQTILTQSAETYRKVRNTIRYCLSNIYDFTPVDEVPLDRMTGLDRWVLSELGALAREVSDAYEQYAFHRVAKAVHEFCTVRLSNFYLDVLKDLLYTAHPKDPRRRSAQTALWLIAKTLIRLLAPILPVTAEEAWAALPGAASGSVHRQSWPDAGELPDDAALRQQWARLLQVRDEAMKALEQARSAGLIGDALEAELEISAGQSDWDFLNSHQADLAAACIVSELRLAKSAAAGSGLEIQVKKSSGAKCERCWMRLATVGQSAEHPALCRRCVEVVRKLGQ